MYKFNQAIRDKVDEIKIDHFFEVTEMINQLIQEKAIFEE